MSEVAEILSKPTNYAVVQLPGRAFPGVVFQGDSLNSLTTRVAELRSLSEMAHEEEITAGLTEMFEQLSEVVAHYESVCRARGISLPYSRSRSSNERDAGETQSE